MSNRLARKWRRFGTCARYCEDCRESPLMSPADCRCAHPRCKHTRNEERRQARSARFHEMLVACGRVIADVAAEEAMTARTLLSYKLQVSSTYGVVRAP